MKTIRKFISQIEYFIGSYLVLFQNLKIRFPKTLSYFNPLHIHLFTVTGRKMIPSLMQSSPGVKAFFQVNFPESASISKKSPPLNKKSKDLIQLKYPSYILEAI
jgi:hypothetical protein